MLDHVRAVLGQAWNPAVAACFEYWRRKQSLCGQPLPGRQHIDPVEMRAFLPYVVLFDVVRAGVHCRFRHRLAGTEFDRIFGRDVTGMFIEHTGPLEDFDIVYRRFLAVADDKMLVYGVAPSPARDRDFLQYEHLTLPLASDGETVDILFGVRCVLAASWERDACGYRTAPLLAG
ncbi:MAG TPA: PAS domain-containing protein [Methylomirabilota bacterium]|nr:PAS domain-containing protein [Methylomirabilota bacterium]